jgi:RNA polymerase sigma-70 factor (ECF subfamily)
MPADDYPTRAPNCIHLFAAFPKTKKLPFSGVQPSPPARYHHKNTGPTMTSNSSATNDLLNRVRGGDQQALASLFARHRDRLRRMVRLRFDRRLHGRVDPSDVLHEAYLDVSQRVTEYLANPAVPFFLWLRFLTGQQLVGIHRRHLGAQMSDAGQEVCLHRGALPQATSASLAAQLLGRLTSPTQAAARVEMQIRLQEALNAMDPTDREVLVLRHFEELSNNETAEVLGIPKAAASNCYIRALKRLKDILAAMPGFLDKH